MGFGSHYAIPQEPYIYESARKLGLQSYAATLSAGAKAGGITDGEAFAAIVQFDAMLVHNLPGQADGMFRASVMIDDLRRVLIGDSMTSDGRNHGPFALPYQAFLDSGFKKEFQDDSNQVQHAMAGIYIAYHYGRPGMAFARWQEDGEADLRLYAATFPMGLYLSGRNYMMLPGLIRNTLLAEGLLQVRK